MTICENNLVLSKIIVFVNIILLFILKLIIWKFQTQLGKRPLRESLLSPFSLPKRATSLTVDTNIIPSSYVNVAALSGAFLAIKDVPLIISTLLLKALDVFTLSFYDPTVLVLTTLWPKISVRRSSVRQYRWDQISCQLTSNLFTIPSCPKVRVGGK